MIEDLDEHGKFRCIANGVAGILNYQYYFIRSFFKKTYSLKKMKLVLNLSSIMCFKI